jgi:hypothetical protein
MNIEDAGGTEEDGLAGAPEPDPGMSRRGSLVIAIVGIQAGLDYSKSLLSVTSHN